jgi:hypothetical protein
MNSIGIDCQGLFVSILACLSASEAKAAIFGYRCDVAEGPKETGDYGSGIGLSLRVRK